MSEKKDAWGWKSIDEWQWRSYDGKKRIDVNSFIEEHKNDLFFIGTDSQNYSKRHSCVFTSALIAYKLHKGGSIVIHRDRTPFMPSLRQRLLAEAMRSLEVAWYLNKRVPNESIIGIHLDINSNLKYKSGQYKEELVGLIMAQGFKAFIKPDSWGASKIADSRC